MKIHLIQFSFNTGRTSFCLFEFLGNALKHDGTFFKLFYNQQCS